MTSHIKDHDVGGKKRRFTELLSERGARARTTRTAAGGEGRRVTANPPPQQRTRPGLHNIQPPPSPIPHPPVPQQQPTHQPVPQIEALQPVDAFVRAVELPFFDTVQELLPLAHVGVKGVRVFELTVPRQLMEELIPARDFHILMRLFHYTPGMIVLNDALPDNCAIVINQEHEVRVGMPDVLHNPYPNMPKRFHCRPIDLSYDLRREFRRAGRPNTVQTMQQPTQNFSFRVMLHWDGHSAKRWVVGVWAVRRVSVNTLFDRLMGDQRRVIAKQKTMKEAQREAVGKNGEGVQILDAPSMSLLCPYSMTRMQVPVRSANCFHLQCFDLRNYLAMNEKNPRWKCPVCGLSALYSELRVDELAKELVARAGPEVRKVELTSQSRWRDVEGKWEMTVAGVPLKKVLVPRRKTLTTMKKGGTVNVGEEGGARDDTVLNAVMASDIPSMLEKMALAAFGLKIVD